jgi:glycosyltransferase involved in cell wall biosynthesis
MNPNHPASRRRFLKTAVLFAVLVAAWPAFAANRDRHVVLITLDGFPAYLWRDPSIPLPNLRRLGQRGDMPRLLAASDIAVSSSAFGEGFSNAIAEGMAAGLPVVATEVGDARIIIGETGLVVPARDPERLAAAIGRLAGEPPEALRARGACARQRIEREFPLSRAAESFRHLYRELS